MNRQAADSNIMMEELSMEFDLDEMTAEGPSAESKKLEKIRHLSNVIQALENLEVQCSDFEISFNLREFAKFAVTDYREKLYREIHSQ